MILHTGYAVAQFKLKNKSARFVLDLGFINSLEINIEQGKKILSWSDTMKPARGMEFKGFNTEMF